MEAKFKIELTAKEIDIIAAGLGKLPLETSIVVYNNISQQYQIQVMQQNVQDVEAK